FRSGEVVVKYLPRYHSSWLLRKILRKIDGDLIRFAISSPAFPKVNFRNAVSRGRCRSGRMGCPNEILCAWHDPRGNLSACMSLFQSLKNIKGGHAETDAVDIQSRDI